MTQPQRGKCPHIGYKVIYLENDNGSVQLEICMNPKCAKIKTICEHRKSTWNPDGTVLICNFCGADGT